MTSFSSEATYKPLGVLSNISCAVLEMDPSVMARCPANERYNIILKTFFALPWVALWQFIIWYISISSFGVNEHAAILLASFISAGITYLEIKISTNTSPWGRTARIIISIVISWVCSIGVGAALISGDAAKEMKQQRADALIKVDQEYDERANNAEATTIATLKSSRDNLLVQRTILLDKIQALQGARATQVDQMTNSSVDASRQQYGLDRPGNTIKKGIGPEYRDATAKRAKAETTINAIDRDIVFLKGECAAIDTKVGQIGQELEQANNRRDQTIAAVRAEQAHSTHNLPTEWDGIGWRIGVLEKVKNDPEKGPAVIIVMDVILIGNIIMDLLFIIICTFGPKCDTYNRLKECKYLITIESHEVQAVLAAENARAMQAAAQRDDVRHIREEIFGGYQSATAPLYGFDEFLKAQKATENSARQTASMMPESGGQILSGYFDALSKGYDMAGHKMAPSSVSSKRTNNQKPSNTGNVFWLRDPPDDPPKSA